jgi:lambda repressor-like predicted transcriptional regulator
MLRDLLESRGISIASLVRESGLSRRTVEDILKRGDCRISTARVIADTLGCTLDELYAKD